MTAWDLLRCIELDAIFISFMLWYSGYFFILPKDRAKSMFSVAYLTSLYLL